jgi:hypothetical protein
VVELVSRIVAAVGILGYTIVIVVLSFFFSFLTIQLGGGDVELSTCRWVYDCILFR